MIGEPRFTFELLELQDGIGLVPAMTGLFAITEIVTWIQQRGTIARLGRIEGSVWQGLFATFRYPVALIRSTLVGLMVGLVPGIGATAASFLSYEVEKRSSSRPDRFGQGAPEGVIAPEAANNSAIAAGLAPALMLGIPGGATSALLLVALTVHGIRPGIMLFNDQPDLVYGFLIGLLIGAFMFMFVSAAFARWLAMVTLVRAEIIAPSFPGDLVCRRLSPRTSSSATSSSRSLFGLFGCLAKTLGFPSRAARARLVLGRTPGDVVPPVAGHLRRRLVGVLHPPAQRLDARHGGGGDCPAGHRPNSPHRPPSAAATLGRDGRSVTPADRTRQPAAARPSERSVAARPRYGTWAGMAATCGPGATVAPFCEHETHPG